MAYTPATLAVPKGGTGQTTLTLHGILVGEGTAAINQLAVGTAGQVMQSGGAAADPLWSTATYPSTASTVGTILRSNGTNWIQTFATYPTSIGANQLLVASSNNAITPLATANSGVLATNASGVPSIDTTNFAVLSTGLQLKGNNTNTAPPAGFIGERITSAVTSVGVSSSTPTNLTSISLTAGIWDIGINAQYLASASGTAFVLGVSTTSATFSGNQGDQQTQRVGTALTQDSICLVGFRALVSSTTTYYLVTQVNLASGTVAVNGRISAVRVG
jgi:hypothetical protein